MSNLAASSHETADPCQEFFPLAWVTANLVPTKLFGCNGQTRSSMNSLAQKTPETSARDVLPYAFSTRAPES